MSTSIYNYLIYGSSAAVIGTATSTLLNMVTYPIFKLFPTVNENIFDDVATLIIAAATSSIGIYIGDRTMGYVFGNNLWIENDPTGGVFLLSTILMSNIHYNARIKALAIDLGQYLGSSIERVGVKAVKQKKEKMQEKTENVKN